jgi:hypothetical protein
MDLSDYHNIIKYQLETQLSNCEYVYITCTRPGSDIQWLRKDSIYQPGQCDCAHRAVPEKLHEIPYRVTKSTNISAIESRGKISLYNCVINKQETIDIKHIFTTAVHFKGHPDHSTLNKAAIKLFKDTARGKLKGDDLVLLGEELKISLLDFYSLDPYGALNTYENLKLIKFFKCDDMIDVLDVASDEARDKWTKLIYEKIDQAKEYLISTKLEADENDTEEIEEIDSLISLMNESRAAVDEDLEVIVRGIESPANNIEAILDYWPAIILPKPLYL